MRYIIVKHPKQDLEVKLIDSDVLPYGRLKKELNQGSLALKTLCRSKERDDFFIDMWFDDDGILIPLDRNIELPGMSTYFVGPIVISSSRDGSEDMYTLTEGEKDEMCRIFREPSKVFWY